MLMFYIALLIVFAATLLVVWVGNEDSCSR